jgi:hypothetical protein
MIETILNGLLPVAFIILLGGLSARIGMLKHEDASVLATLVIRFALPFALFEGAVRTSPDKLAQSPRRCENGHRTEQTGNVEPHRPAWQVVPFGVRG